MFVIYGRLAANPEIIETIESPVADLKAAQMEVSFQQNMNAEYCKVWYEDDQLNNGCTV